MLAAAPAAAQVEHEAFLADERDELPQTLPFQAPVAEDPRGDDDMRRTGIQPGPCIVGIDAAAELETARPSREGFAGRRFVPGTELDHMPADKPVAVVELGEPSGRLLGHEVGGHAGAAVRQRAADDLGHAAVAEVDARSEHGSNLNGGPRRQKHGKHLDLPTGLRGPRPDLSLAGASAPVRRPGRDRRAPPG